MTAAARLDEIFGNLDSFTSWWGRPVIREIKPGEIDSDFWRGRVVYSHGEVKSIVDSPAREIGPPPSEKAKAGRMNAEGISVFYGALEEETCLAEIRAPVGSYVALGKFSLTRPVRIIDLRDLSIADDKVSHFDPKYREARSRQKFLWEWVREISLPVMPHDETKEYLASQAVSDYLANRLDPQLDGMIFRSSQTGGNGRNLVFFNHACKVVADDPNPDPGIRVKIPHLPTIPPPGAKPSGESTVQTDPPKPQKESQLQGDTVFSDDSAVQQDDRITTLRLNRESLKFLQVLGVKHDSKVLEKNALHYLTVRSTIAPTSNSAVLNVRNPQPQ
jgi:hypothetical protein